MKETKNSAFSFFLYQVELTWDENDVDRIELNEKVNTGKLNEIPDAELRKFVAYSSDEEDGSEDALSEADHSDSEPDAKQEASTTKRSRKKDDVIAKYKNLLNDISKKEEAKKKNKIEMEFSWGINTKETASKSDNDEKTLNDTELNPFEKLIEKKREKKRARKEKVRQLKKQQNHSGESESEDDLPDGIDLNDPYFAEEFANGEFAPVKSKKSKAKKTHARNDDENGSIEQKDLELLLDDDDDHKAHFSLKKIQERENESKTSKKHRKKLKQNKSNDDKKSMDDDFQINTTDNRFAAIYSSHLFNIDPTDSHYRKTKAMDTLIQEKLKRKRNDGDAINVANVAENGEPSEKKRKNVADSILIKSIKRKVQQQNQQK